MLLSCVVTAAAATVDDGVNVTLSSMLLVSELGGCCIVFFILKFRCEIAVFPSPFSLGRSSRADIIRGSGDNAGGTNSCRRCRFLCSNAEGELESKDGENPSRNSVDDDADSIFLIGSEEE